MTELASADRFRLSAHLAYLFEGLPLAARFNGARRAGFRAIEIPDPYGLSISDFAALCTQNDLGVAQIALPNGRCGASKKGFAALPGKETEFEDALMRSIAFAKAVDCPMIHPMSGTYVPSEPLPRWETYLSNIAKACSVAANEGLCVIMEAISSSGTPDYFMNSLQRASAAIDLVDAPNLFLLVDTFHAAAMGVELPSFLLERAGRIAHVQVADWPRRNEPGSGEIDFDAVFAALAASNYKGHVGLEYVPSLKGAGRFDWTGKFDAYLEPLRNQEEWATN